MYTIHKNAINGSIYRGKIVCFHKWPHWTVVQEIKRKSVFSK